MARLTAEAGMRLAASPRARVLLLVAATAVSLGGAVAETSEPCGGVILRLILHQAFAAKMHRPGCGQGIPA